MDARKPCASDVIRICVPLFIIHYLSLSLLLLLLLLLLMVLEESRKRRRSNGHDEILIK